MFRMHCLVVVPLIAAVIILVEVDRNSRSVHPCLLLLSSPGIRAVEGSAFNAVFARDVMRTPMWVVIASHGQCTLVRCREFAIPSDDWAEIVLCNGRRVVLDNRSWFGIPLRPIIIVCLAYVACTLRTGVLLLRARRSGLCTMCGYDLRGASAGQCSECGAVIDLRQLRARRRAGP